MQEPRIPRNESQRLKALRRLDILDTIAEERYERLTRITQKLFDVPIVVVSLVDSERQWFKSKIGLEAEELPRRISFCGHAILQKNAFVVNDTHKDPRFADNPLVTDKPYLRFYAGQPLQTANGMMVGTLCILDYKPRDFHQADLNLLKDLAIQVELELNNPDLQRMTTSLKQSEDKLLKTIRLLEKKEQRERANKHCLEMVSRGEPLPATLKAIITAVEQENPAYLACILTIDSNNNGLTISASPNMPKQFSAALDGISLQEGLDSCEASLCHGNAIQPQKDKTHPYWSKFSTIARNAGFASAWSQPIKDSDEKILGIFVICKKQLGYPDEDDMLLIEESANLSAIALERAHTDLFIKSKAYYDPLTGLPNRNMLLDRLKQEMLKATRYGLQVAFLFIDLDHFKEINDNLGHQKGDQLLIEVASRLKKHVRSLDTVARLGGDEFVAIIGELSDSSVVDHVARKILLALAKPFQLDDEIAYLSASIGIAISSHNGDDMDSLISNADQAMYEAKSNGRNCIQYFSQVMQENALMRVNLLLDLRQAISKNQFKITYQPVIDLSNGHTAKAEALLNWHHPQRGYVAPRDFLPLAEETGLILEIGEWFFTHLLAQLEIWYGQFDDQFHVSINTSPLQFREDNNGLENLVERLSAIGLPASSLGIEITESLLMEKRAGVQQLLSSIQKAGVAIALDDFGSGLTPLHKLQDFHIDYLKINKTLIQRIDIDLKARQLCEGMIVMAHKIGIKVVAKGVETEKQKHILVEAGADFAQGYLFSHAVDASNFSFNI